MYYIYHIKGVKIGVSEEPKQRVVNQGFSDYEILEEHTDIYKVSDREIELQKQYGYKVDTTPYWQTCQCAIKGGLSKSKESLVSMRKLSSDKTRKLTYEQAEYIRAQYKRGKDVFGKKISHRRLATVFGVDSKCIGCILRNENYTTP